MQTLIVTRPQPIRIVAFLTLCVILVWAARTGDISEFGVLIYPAIIALQTAREWSWQLAVTPAGLRERQGIGAPRDFKWSQVEGVILPDSSWWRINPVLKITEAPNIQLTAAENTEAVIKLARRKGKPIQGSVESISLVRSLAPLAIMMGLACILLASQLAGATG